MVNWMATSLCRRYNILLAHDAAYDLVTFGNYKAPSALQIPGAKDYVVELGSLSKSFNESRLFAKMFFIHI